LAQRPNFFYTSPERETVALDRADAVIAIKQSEACTLRTLTARTVFSLPYWDDRHDGDCHRDDRLAEVCRLDDSSGSGKRDVYDHKRPLRLGFLGALNSVNILNLRRFLSIFSRYVTLYNTPVEVTIAGNVCTGIAEEYPFTKKLGFVDDPADFYEYIDAVVVPLEFSTGIKIKVAEALAWGVPVLATRDAFDGFRAHHRTQQAATVHALCQMIVSVAFGEISSDELASATRKAGMAAAAAQDKGFAELEGWIDRSLGPVMRACQRLLSCLNEPVQQLGPDEVLERAVALSREDVFRPLAEHCAHHICQALGHPTGSWGLSQKIFQHDFDLHGQISWINKQVAADS
jgi:hypothetical protein